MEPFGVAEAVLVNWRLNQMGLLSEEEEGCQPAGTLHNSNYIIWVFECSIGDFMFVQRRFRCCS